MRAAIAGLFAVLVGLGSGRLHAQGSIGELRLLVVGAAALGPSNAHPPFPADGPPGGRGLGGLTGSFSFVRGRLALGPEAAVLFGNDRRMYELGGVLRFSFAGGPVRPYLLLGAGYYSWDRKRIPPFAPQLGPTWERDKTYVTGNAGAGLTVGSRRVQMVTELRGHKSLGYDRFFGSRDMVTLSTGARISW